MKNNKYLLFSTLLISLIFLSAGSALALEVPLPGLCSDPKNCNPSLPEYVIYIFTLLVSLAGAISLISFVVGAVGLINPNIEAHKDAKDRMKGAILGLVLTLSSFLIIKTINPALTKPTLNPLPPVVLPPAPPQPGVYYYLKPGCSGDSSGANTVSGNIADPFKGNIQSIRIINDLTNKLNYGVVFHKTIGLENGGLCNTPMSHPQEATTCLRVENPSYTYAADIFIENITSGESGDGVIFYSEPYGWNTGANAGYLPATDSDIMNDRYRPQDTSKMNFEWEGVDQPETYQKMFDTFRKQAGSIKIKGNYLVGLYSRDSDKNQYCQTFTKDVNNLNAEPATAYGQNSIDEVYIIPTK